MPGEPGFDVHRRGVKVSEGPVPPSRDLDEILRRVDSGKVQPHLPGELLQDLLQEADVLPVDIVEYGSDSELAGVHGPPDEDGPAVNARSYEIPHRRAASVFQVENDDPAAGHVFAAVVLGGAADDEDGDLVLILLHVNARPVFHVPADQDLSAPHGIPRDFAGLADHHDLPRVHGVCDAVLRVSQNPDLRPVHERAQILPRRPVNDDPAGNVQSPADVALAEDVLQDDLLLPLEKRDANPAVQISVIEVLRIDGRRHSTPPHASRPESPVPPRSVPHPGAGRDFP